MGRLDIRVNTCLSARLQVPNCSLGVEPAECLLTELSLGGAFVSGVTLAPGTQAALTFKLPDYGRLSLPVQSTRISCHTTASTALRIFCSDPQALAAIWRHVHDRWRFENACPYCGSNQCVEEACCQSCGFPLDQDSPEYLDRHLARTLHPRLRQRLRRPSIHQARRLLHFIDSELLELSDVQEEEFVGSSPCMLEVFSMIKKVAPTEMSVLILGESGTGKELTARAVHERSTRRGRPFIVVNCAAIPETLLEAELFGFERGAFTGAFTPKKGKFEQADGGTLFLDEIGDLPHALQSKLLRFLEDRIVERLGSKEGKKVDVRVIAATNCDLPQMVDTQRFRSDLFFRLNAFTITLQPLRSRGDDKMVLANFFLQRISRRDKYPSKVFSRRALQAIERYAWPGNVRELINRIRRGLVMAAGSSIEPEDLDLPNEELEAPSLRARAEQCQKEMVLTALTENGFVVAHAARSLGMSRPNIYNLLKKYEIDLEAFRRQRRLRKETSGQV